MIEAKQQDYSPSFLIKHGETITVIAIMLASFYWMIADLLPDIGAALKSDAIYYTKSIRKWYSDINFTWFDIKALPRDEQYREK